MTRFDVRITTHANTVPASGFKDSAFTIEAETAGAAKIQAIRMVTRNRPDIRFTITAEPVDPPTNTLGLFGLRASTATASITTLPASPRQSPRRRSYLDLSPPEKQTP